MSIEESSIWNRFLASSNNICSHYDYDLRVGVGITPLVPIPNRYTKNYEDLTKKRIDAVGYLNGSAHIYEVKVRATISVLGQLLGYSILFKQTYPTIQVASLNLLCSSISEEDISILKQHSITVTLI